MPGIVQTRRTQQPHRTLRAGTAHQVGVCPRKRRALPSPRGARTPPRRSLAPLGRCPGCQGPNGRRARTGNPHYPARPGHRRGSLRLPGQRPLHPRQGIRPSIRALEQGLRARPARPRRPQARRHRTAKPHGVTRQPPTKGARGVGCCAFDADWRVLAGAGSVGSGWGGGLRTKNVPGPAATASTPRRWKPVRGVCSGV
jgi:hypothetical protein